MSGANICFINTLPRAFGFFLKPQMDHLFHMGHRLTFISSYDAALTARFPREYRYLVVPMKRGLDLLRMPLLIWSLYRIFKKECFDLIQYSGPNAALYAAIAGRLAGVPVRIYAQWGIRYVGFSGIARWAFKMVERLTCLCSTVIQPDSVGNLKFAISERLYPSDKGRVIWNGSACGVDLVKFNIEKKNEWHRDTRMNLGLPAEAFVLGFVGALRRDKGLDELLIAFRSLLAENQNLWLLLAGDKDFYSTVDPGLRDFAEHCPRVIFSLPSPEIPKLLAAIDLFVFPSYREGFGSVVIEAEAMGVPVLVSDIPGPVDAIQPGITGLVVEVRDWRGLASAIRNLSSDPSRLISMGRAAVPFVKERFEQKELMTRFGEDKAKLLVASKGQKNS